MLTSITSICIGKWATWVLVGKGGGKFGIARRTPRGGDSLLGLLDGKDHTPIDAHKSFRYRGAWQSPREKAWSDPDVTLAPPQQLKWVDKINAVIAGFPGHRMEIYLAHCLLRPSARRSSKWLARWKHEVQQQHRRATWETLLKPLAKHGFRDGDIRTQFQNEVGRWIRASRGMRQASADITPLLVSTDGGCIPNHNSACWGFVVEVSLGGPALRMIRDKFLTDKVPLQDFIPLFGPVDIRPGCVFHCGASRRATQLNSRPFSWPCASS